MEREMAFLFSVAVTLIVWIRGKRISLVNISFWLHYLIDYGLEGETLIIGGSLNLNLS